MSHNKALFIYIIMNAEVHESFLNSLELRQKNVQLGALTLCGALTTTFIETFIGIHGQTRSGGL